jgi:hypothetical protein
VAAPTVAAGPVGTFRRRPPGSPRNSITMLGIMPGRGVEPKARGLDDMTRASTSSTGAAGGPL